MLRAGTGPLGPVPQCGVVGVGHTEGSKRKQHTAPTGAGGCPNPAVSLLPAAAPWTRRWSFVFYTHHILYTVRPNVCTTTRPVYSVALVSQSPYFQGLTGTGHKQWMFFRHHPGEKTGPPFPQCSFRFRFQAGALAGQPPLCLPLPSRSSGP